MILTFGRDRVDAPRNLVVSLAKEASTLFGIALALILDGIGRIGLSDWQATLLSWILFVLGGLFMFAAIFKRRKSRKSQPHPSINQKTHGSHSPAIAQGSGTQNIHIYPPAIPAPLPAHTLSPELSTKTLPKVMAVR